MRELDELSEDMAVAEEMLEMDDGTFFDAETRKDVESALKVVHTLNVINPIDIVLYSLIGIMGILMIFRVRFSFIVSLISVILTTITFIFYAVALIINGGFEGFADTVEGGIFVVLVRIAVIRMLIGSVIATAGNNEPAPAPYVAPPSSFAPLTPTDRSDNAVDPVTGQSTSIPPMLQKGQNVHSSAAMQSVTPVPPAAQGQSDAGAQPDWQCRGCGFINSAKNDTCTFCSSKRE
ncbi:MAG: hypothetical protein ACI4KA_06115 [Oscillospiraceae bacterium]